jgi:hypothetical protein
MSTGFGTILGRSEYLDQSFVELLGQFDPEHVAGLHRLEGQGQVETESDIGELGLVRVEPESSV